MNLGRRVLYLVLALWILCGVSDRSFSADQPNVLFIVSDDQAWTDYGFMGHPTIRTPNLDQLATESLLFRRGYVTSSLCCPSLATMLTGLYPHQHKITSNDPPIDPKLKAGEFYQSRQYLDGRKRMNEHFASVPSLATILTKSGYRTLQTGKWWQGDFRNGGFSHGMTRGDRHGDLGLEIGRKTLEPIYSFMDMCRDERKPFFIWYAPMMPHDPHTPPTELLEYYRTKTDSLHLARYWAMVEWFDQTVGELLHQIDQRGLAKETIVVFLADNGWIQDTEHARYAPKSKQSPYDGGVRTPIMIRWRGHIRPESSPELAQSIDLLPTLIAATSPSSVKENHREALPGINLLDSEMRKNRSVLFGECFTHNAIDLDSPAKNLRWRWMIDRDWKLIVPDPIQEPNGTIELYELESDPMETVNLFNQQNAKAESMLSHLDGWWKP